jgi:hypothetical protein
LAAGWRKGQEGGDSGYYYDTGLLLRSPLLAN